MAAVLNLGSLKLSFKAMKTCYFLPLTLLVAGL